MSNLTLGTADIVILAVLAILFILGIRIVAVFLTAKK